MIHVNPYHVAYQFYSNSKCSVPLEVFLTADAVVWLCEHQDSRTVPHMLARGQHHCFHRIHRIQTTSIIHQVYRLVCTNLEAPSGSCAAVTVPCPRVDKLLITVPPLKQAIKLGTWNLRSRNPSSQLPIPRHLKHKQFFRKTEQVHWPVRWRVL